MTNPGSPTPEELERAYFEKRAAKRRKALKIGLVVVSLVLVAIGVALIPVVRISMAVPGSNPNSVQEVHDLIDRFQEEGADPEAGNAYDMLVSAVTAYGVVQDDVEARFTEAVEGDKRVREFVGPSDAYSISWAAYQDVAQSNP